MNVLPDHLIVTIHANSIDEFVCHGVHHNESRRADSMLMSMVYTLG